MTKSELLKRIEALEAEVALLRARPVPFVGPVPAAPLPPANPYVPGWPTAPGQVWFSTGSQPALTGTTSS